MLLPFSGFRVYGLIPISLGFVVYMCILATVAQILHDASLATLCCKEADCLYNYVFAYACHVAKASFSAVVRSFAYR